MGDNWMETLLGERGFLVSGTELLGRRLGLTSPHEGRPSLRFVTTGLSASRALFFVVVENVPSDRAPKTLRALRNHPLYQLLEDKLRPMHILLTLKDGSFYLDRRMVSEELAQWFYRQEPSLKQSVGTSKEVNRPESQRKSDIFRTFTRSYLSRYCISNDIDALRLAETQGQRPLVLELKKTKESVGEWKPYIDDCANYAFLMALARERNFESRVIAYNKDQRERVKLLLDVECDKPSRSATRVRYRWALVTPDEALGVVPGALRLGDSRRRRQGR